MNSKRVKLLRISTVPISLKVLTKGQLLFLNSKGFDVYTASGNGKEIVDLYSDEKIIEHFSIALTRKISPIEDLKALFQCYKLIRDKKFDIVHTYTPKAGLIGMVASFLAGTKIRIHNVTGLPLLEKKGLFKFILNIIEKITYMCSTNVYVNSTGLLTYIKEYISKNRKVRVLGNGSTNGIDGDYFKHTVQLKNESNDLKKSLGIEDNDFVWIFVGRLVNDKGIKELVDAFSLFSNYSYNTKLVLVGDFEQDLDPLSEVTLSKINNLKTVLRVGYQSDIRPYLCLSNCLIFPSYREGLPNVPLQAACMSLPIIATNINGCNEIVKNGINGLLVKPKNSIDLFEKMIQMYNDKFFRENIQKSTREIILSQYDQKKVWSNLLDEYNQLLRKK